MLNYGKTMLDIFRANCQNISKGVDRSMEASKTISDRQYERMTRTPVHRLILTLGLPTTISMLVTNVYNMADTYFVSTLGTSASGAVGIVFALMAIIQAFGFMFGQGAGSCLSRQLGQKHLDEARTYAAASFYLSIACGLGITALGLILLTPLMYLLGSTDSILPYARIYSTYILIAAPAMTAGCVMNNILRYEGKAVFAMIGLGSGGILNIFGDYLLIGHFHMGIAGAGLSTAVSQYISFMILLMPFIRKKVQTNFHPRYILRQMRTRRNAGGEIPTGSAPRGIFAYIRDIIVVGCPSMMRQGLTSISVMILNQCAAAYSSAEMADAVIAAMSIVSRVVNFLFCVGIGIGQGFQPVSAFNYGAGRYDRVKEAWRFTWLFSTGMMAVMAVIGFVFSEPIIRIFRDDPDVITVGIPALRMQCAALLFMPLCLSGNMLFQSIGKSGRAILLSSIRSGLLFIPVLLITSRLFGIPGIQMSQALADTLSGLIAAPMIYDFFRKL